MSRTKFAAAALLAALAVPWSGGPACAGAVAAQLRPWTRLDPGVDCGTWTDGAGSKVALAVVPAPLPGSRALRMDSDIVQWAGAWFAVRRTLPPGEALRFRARSDQSLAVNVILGDRGRRQDLHIVRLRGGRWQTFILPESCFKAPDWPTPGSDPGAFDPYGLVSVAFSPADPGRSALEVGPLEEVPAPARPRDGGMEPGTVQDFLALPRTGFGPFSDALGSSIALTVEHGARGAYEARVKYLLVPKGWCGVWIRAGQDWRGQDWGRGSGLAVEARSRSPLRLQLAFNDANQNAYLSPPLELEPGAWRVLRAPFASFRPNPYYQPPHARPGAPLDLGRVDTFNLSPLTPGRHAFEVRLVRLEGGGAPPAQGQAR